MNITKTTYFRCISPITRDGCDFTIGHIYHRRLPSQTGAILDKDGGGVTAFSDEEMVAHFQEATQVRCTRDYASGGRIVFRTGTSYWATGIDTDRINVFPNRNESAVAFGPALFKTHFTDRL